MTPQELEARQAKYRLVKGDYSRHGRPRVDPDTDPSILEA